MAAPTTPPRRSALRWSLLLLLLLLIAGGALGGWYFLQRTRADASRLVVRFVSPETGALADLNVPVIVQAAGEDDAGVTRLELYADGALVAVQGSTLTNDSNPLVFLQPWTPVTPGRHVLMVRGYNGRNAFADSSVAYVDVVQPRPVAVCVNVDTVPRPAGTPLPSLNDLASASGISLEQLLAANPAAASFDPAAPLPAGTSLAISTSPDAPPTDCAAAPASAGSGTPGGTSAGGSPGGAPGGAPPGGGAPGGGVPGPGGSGAPPAGGSPPGGGGASDGSRGVLPPLPLPLAPDAPTGLNVTADCTSAQLAWVDSPNDGGYAVYRLGPGDTHFNQITVLPANATTFSDTLPSFGAYRYQVAAVRILEGLTPIVVVNTPDSCGAGSTSDPVLTVLQLETDAAGRAYDGTYCYFSVDGSAYERAPADDWNIFSADSGAEFWLFSLPRQLPNRGEYVLAGQPDASPITLAGRCLGRSGTETYLLGNFSVSHPSSDWDGTNRQVPILDAGVTRAILHYRIGRGLPEIRARDLTDLLGGLTPPIDILIPSLVTAPNIPPVTNIHFNPSGREACDTLSAAGFPFSPRVACQLLGQPTLTWDWTGSALVSEADLLGFALMIDGIPAIDARPAARHAALVPPGYLHCGETRDLSIIPVNLRGERSSEDSSWAQGRLTTPACASEVTVQVTYQTFAIGGSAAHGGEIVDDGDICVFCTDRRMELLGGIGSTAPQVQGLFWLGNITAELPSPFNPLGVIGRVLDDTIGRALRLVFGGCLDISTCLEAGTYAWADQYLHDTGSVFARQNNTSYTLTVHDGQSLTVGAALSDFDLLNGPDPWCVTQVELARRSAGEWAVLNQDVTLTDDRGEASCTIVVHVQAVSSR
jgi:hypothetical protein